jgi:NADPH:quinone reductase
MLALVSTPDGSEPVEIREASEPDPAPDETLVEVRAFSINRGELSLVSNRPEGWRPGQDVAGVVAQAAADGSGPPRGARVAAVADEAG